MSLELPWLSVLDGKITEMRKYAVLVSEVKKREMRSYFTLIS